MPETTIKKCINCQHQVDLTYSGACPNCGKTSGYDLAVSVDEVVSVDEIVTSYKNSMKNAIADANQRYEELEKKFKDNKNVLNKIKVLKKSLKSEESKLIKQAEEDALKEISKTKTFTVDAIIGTEEQRKEFLEKNVKSEIKANTEKTAKDLIEEMLLKQEQANTGIQKIHDRLSPTQTIFFGLGIGVIGSIIGGFIVATLTGDPSNVPVDLSTNMTNGTQP